MGKILGLDLGTNSIGWSVINYTTDKDENVVLQGISSAGSRIIPMDASAMSNFGKGNTQSQTKERTRMRGVRRMIERSILRRERLLRVLSKMNYLPTHFQEKIDRYGKFINHEEPLLAWAKDKNGKPTFLFKDSFEEMISDFKDKNPEWVENGKKIPYDWTLYYLRKKALTEKISKEELAWILLNFNQKRGYYQRDTDDQTNDKKQIKYYALKVISVEDTGEKKDDSTWYNVKLENGWIYRRASKIPLDWTGKTKEFVVTTELDGSGNLKKDKDGQIKRSFRAPKPEDWALIKVKIQEQIDESGKTVGAYIYESLLDNPMQKIRGKLVQTIDRKYYKEELYKILNKQKEYHNELNDNSLLSDCILELYQQNEAHRKILEEKDFVYFLLEDILFYQRPLKSKKSLINDCPYEFHSYRKDGEVHKEYLKCVAKSHPLYQEFRLWHFISGLRIYKREMQIDGALKTDVDVTEIFITDDNVYAALYEWLSCRKEISQDTFLSFKEFGIDKKEQKDYRWNYTEDRSYVCNETRTSILSRLGRMENANFKISGKKETELWQILYSTSDQNELREKLKAFAKKNKQKEDFIKFFMRMSPLFNTEKETELWHILYSVSDTQELQKALKSFAEKNNLYETFADAFIKMPPFEKEYGSYSFKAINRLLPLMRHGKYWNSKDIDNATQKRIEKIITGEFDESISERVREKTNHLTELASFRGLPLWLACYIVYNRHSEPDNISMWKSPSDIDDYLKKFKQHSLRNPIVEQVIMETLRVVRDIWKQEGHIDEIHIELGREMKNPAQERKRISEQMQENEYTNWRIKTLLTAFMNPEFEIKEVRPNSARQQDILRLYEEGALASTKEDDMPKDILDILKKFKENDINKRPTNSEILRYRLWLEQKYRSPYTGEGIPLGKLFTPEYEIEHVIPKERYFDDSLSNKVICESAVNKAKGAQLAYEFIKNNQGRLIDLGGKQKVKIFNVPEYEDFVKTNYGKNKSKFRKLLLEDIPETFIERQLNDSRYISKVIKSLLSNIVREEGEQEDISKNVIVCTGGITDRLKKDWGINDVWNRLILPRFIRMNQLTGSTSFTSTTQSGHIVPAIPLEYQRGFNKKRIDHRHHAMDAIVIACANRNIVNYLNNLSACKGAKISRNDLKNKLCYKSKQDQNGNYTWLIHKPWQTFTQDVYSALENIVVSFKQNQRVINRTKNKYQHYDKDGKKTLFVQAKDNHWAIRKQIHTETVYGEINLRLKNDVPLQEAVNKLQSIVDSSFRKKLRKLIASGYNLEEITRYFEEHNDIWHDINLEKIEIYYFSKDSEDKYFVTRKDLDNKLFANKDHDNDSGKKKNLEEVIKNKIADSAISRILINHLSQNGNDAETAFSPEGIEQMNQNIVSLNNGKPHKPIYKVRVHEKSDRFQVGKKGNNKYKFVEAKKGANLFFAVYEETVTDEETNIKKVCRTFRSVPLTKAIERMKKGLSPAPENENGLPPAFVLSPNDLVYMPSREEIETGQITEPIDSKRIYKVVSFTGNRLFVIPQSVATVIVNKMEFTKINKIELTIEEKLSIKESCIPVKIDRLGKIKINRCL